LYNSLNMSKFVPDKVFLRGVLLHYFNMNKSAAEAHRILVQTYGDNALSDTTCRDWFRRFKNNDFELEDKERSGAPKKFQDKELEQLLDEDPSQTLSELNSSLSMTTVRYWFNEFKRTDRYLHAESHHFLVQKQSAINSLVHRALTISDKEHLQTELNHLKLAIQKNGHDKKDIIKTINKHLQEKSQYLFLISQHTTSVGLSRESDLSIESLNPTLSILSYVKRTTNRISRILNKHNICIIFKTRLKHVTQSALSKHNMVKVFGISGRTLSCDPLIVKFTTIVKRNELIARARYRSSFIASDVRHAWLATRVSLFERSTKLEQHMFAKVRQLAESSNIKRGYGRGSRISGLLMVRPRVVIPLVIRYSRALVRAELLLSPCARFRLLGERLQMPSD
ncbi:MOS1T transposase, partial [Pseudoatta argentina]